jgi:3-oxoacyl-[acyl-carrier-protein] synthase-3
MWGVPLSKDIVTYDWQANTSAASIPRALRWGLAHGRIRPGDLLLMEAIGGGLAWGSALIRW